jgi:hypothetical protein
VDEGDDAHLSFAFGALARINLLDSLYARGPSTATEISPIVALWFFSARRGELSAFISCIDVL